MCNTVIHPDFVLPFLVMYPNDRILAAMGVELVQGPVLLPLYAQKQMRPTPDVLFPGLTVYQVVDVDPELQEMMSLLLQITDGRAFRRLVS